MWYVLNIVIMMAVLMFCKTSCEEGLLGRDARMRTNGAYVG